MKRVFFFFYYLTFYQWEQINKEYLTEDRNFNWKGGIVLITAALVLIFQEYMGGSNFIRGFKPVVDFFNSSGYGDLLISLYWVAAGIFFYFVPAFIVIKFILKEDIKDYGFRFNKDKKVVMLYFLMFFIVVISAWLVSSYPGFLKIYPYYKGTGNSIFELVIWESSRSIRFISLEFFFRGFFIFALVRYLGAYAVFVMTVPYAMIHFGKPMPETCGAIITGIALGTLSLRTKSIFGGVVIHASIAFCMDMFALYHKGVLIKLFF